MKNTTVNIAATIIWVGGLFYPAIWKIQKTTLNLL